MTVTFSDGGQSRATVTIKPSVVKYGETNLVMTSPIGRTYLVLSILGLVSMVFISQLLSNLVTFFFKASPRTFKLVAQAILLSRVKLFVVTQYLFVCSHLQQGFSRNVSGLTSTHDVIAIKGTPHGMLTH